jgi:3-hydroxyisobutyrate dehydrogenase-like beta-hydroxyacid dehydrogenase
VRAWNRTREKAEPLTEHGTAVSDSIEEAAEGANALVTLLADGDAVLDAVAIALGASLDEDAIWIQMSTIGESGTDRCLELARKHGCAFVDAPVLGTKQPAEERKLVVMASGPAELRDRVAQIFDAIAQRTMWVGEAGAGSRLKVATNSWILAIVEGAAETLALAEGLGLDPQLVLDAVDGGPLDLPYLQMKGQAIIRSRLRALVQARPCSQGRLAGRRVRSSAPAGPPPGRDDPAAFGAGSRGPCRPGHERHLPDQRASLSSGSGPSEGGQPEHRIRSLRGRPA